MNKASTPLCAIRVMVSMLPYLKKERINSFLPSKFYSLTFALSFFLPVCNNIMAQAYCTMICNDEVSVSVGINCEATVLYDMVLEDGDNPRLCSPNGKWGYKISVFDEYDNELPTSPTITFDYVGQTLKAKAKHWATGNICWTTIKFVDKIFPKLTCPSAITVSCTESTLPDRTGSPTAIDCSQVNYTYTDKLIDLNCGNPLSKIERRWTVEDGSGNRDYCTQTISIAQPYLNDIVFPQNLDGLELPPLECEWVAVDPASLLPENTGMPRINGKPIITDGPCRLIPSYVDQKVESCEGTYKILRTWTVVNWCSSEIITDLQIIKVVDAYGPVITLPNEISISTENTLCEAMLTLPPATVVDGCSGTVRVSIQTPYGNIDGNGGSLQKVPVGMHIATYYAVDACGNTSTKELKIHVIDDDPPTLICEDQTVVSLTGDGQSSAFTQSFDNGTFDNCCLDGLAIRRVDNGTYANTVTFSCVDVGTIVMVEMQATDCYGNTNSCMVEVSVQDKVAPNISCPTDQILDCDIDKKDLSVYGAAQAEDNCGFDMDYKEQDNTDNCGAGIIVRTWTAIDKNGRTNSCTQTLTLRNNTPWNAQGDDIVWPEDYETSDCIEETSFAPEDLPLVNGEPQVKGNNTCALIASNFEDLVLDIEEPACYKILRTWTVIDWCNYDVDYPEQGGIFRHTQIIKVLDNIDPVFETLPEDIIADASGSNCGASILLPTYTATDCSNNVTVSVNGALGSGFGPFNDVQPGNYKMTYTATDGCGNSTSKEITISVTDNKKPTPVCLNGVSLTIMPGTDTADPMIDIWAVDLNQKSFDNCTLEENLTFAIRFYSPDDTTIPTAESIKFNCDHLGVQAVEMWVIDENGNGDFCITSVIVQDNMNACGTQYSEEEEEVVKEEQMVAVGGKILTTTGETLNNVEVQISHPDKGVYMTKEDGTFHFDDIPVTEGYTVSPYKNDQPLNGVTTFDILVIRKHILKIELMNSPYQMLAADINKSGGVTTFDLVELQKLILGIYDSFPSNTSWRFVVGDYEFESAQGAPSENFPESYLLQDLVEDMMGLNFVAIKIGDVNNSAAVNGLRKASSRSSERATLSFNNQQFKAGDRVSVDFDMEKTIDLAGIQLALRFEEGVLELQEVTANDLLAMTDNNFGLNRVAQGLLTTSWTNPYGIELAEEENVFHLSFIAKQAGNLKEVIQLEANKMAAELYTTDGNIRTIQLATKEPKGTSVQLFQNQPNPFTSESEIGFHLPQQEEIVLSIYNSTGTQVKLIKGIYPKGNNTITLSKSSLPIGGLYYYTLEADNQKLSKKLLFIQQ